MMNLEKKLSEQGREQTTNSTHIMASTAGCVSALTTAPPLLPIKSIKTINSVACDQAFGRLSGEVTREPHAKGDAIVKGEERKRLRRSRVSSRLASLIIIGAINNASKLVKSVYSNVFSFPSQEGCQAISVVLHYSASSCFTWCLVDSLYLYFNHTNSSNPLRRNVFYLLLGWGEFLDFLSSTKSIYFVR